MKLVDLLFLSIKNLWRHKLRSLLTILGVMIGTCAIVIMLSLGIAMNRNFMTQVNQMGNIMQIQIYNYNSGGKTPEGKDIPKLDDKMVAELEKIKGVEGATPVLNISVKMIAGKYVGWLQIIGIKTSMFEALDIPIMQGRSLEDGDTNQMVIGTYVPSNFYNPKATRWEPAPPDFNLMEEDTSITWDMSYGEKYADKTKSKNKLKPVKVEVVGMVGQTGREYDWSAVMPLETVKQYQKEIEKYNKQNNGSGGVIVYGGYSSSSTDNGYQQVIVKAKTIDDVVPVMEAIKEYGYECYSPIQILEEMKKQSAGLRQILLGIGIMSFFIAAIGIANTMYMSIYERTREIGIFKVIGARLKDIKHLFMLEAGWIGVFGGMLGVGLSFLLSYLLNRFNIGLGSSVIWTPEGEQRLPSSYIPIWLALAGLGFSPVASLLAGLLPSRRAMKLSVMRALRQD